MERINSFVAVCVFTALTVVVALQVVNRLFLHLPLIWSEELARFLFFWVALLGAAVSVRKRRHFVLDITMRRRRTHGPVSGAVFALLPNLCVLGFCIFLLIVGIDYGRTGMFRTATNSGINMGLVYAAIPLFALLATVYSVANLLVDVRGLARDRQTAAASRGGRPNVNEPPGD